MADFGFSFFNFRCVFVDLFAEIGFFGKLEKNVCGMEEKRAVFLK